MLDAKLQLKPGQTIAIVDAPDTLELAAPQAAADVADAVIIFTTTQAQLQNRLVDLSAAATTGKLTWLAYPKAKQLGTDLNRDIIRATANDNGLDPVRQIAIDDTWSALRLKSTLNA